MLLLEVPGFVSCEFHLRETNDQKAAGWRGEGRGPGGRELGGELPMGCERGEKWGCRRRTLSGWGAGGPSVERKRRLCVNLWGRGRGREGAFPTGAIVPGRRRAGWGRGDSELADRWPGGVPALPGCLGAPAGRGLTQPRAHAAKGI